MRAVNKKNFSTFILELLRKHWLFFAAFLLMAIYLKTTGPMNNQSGDAASIWATIKSFPTGQIVPSYVMYKGFASIYPYVWFYQLSMFLNLHEFLFIKLYHCLLFAYISAVGFPYFIENLLHIKAKSWRKAILIAILFWYWKDTNAFGQLMVDLPSMAYFLLLLNSALKAAALNGRRSYGRYVYTGLLLGLNICLSGQYALPALAVLLYLLIKMFPRKVRKDKALRSGALICLSVMLVCLLGVRAYNGYFEKTVIDPLREEGAWIPNGKEWVACDFMRLIGVQRSGFGSGIPDNRGLSIVMDLYGDQFDQMYEKMQSGGVSLNPLEYFQIVIKYPMDFLTRYANRLFLALSPTSSKLSFIHLFMAYTLLFAAFLSFRKRCRKVRHFFSAEALLVLSFLLAIAALIVFSIEMRCVMQIQGLIYATALLDDPLWDGIGKVGRPAKHCIMEMLSGIMDKPFPYVLVLYLIFIVFCFMHIASLFELIGIDPTHVLFKY